MSSPKKPPGRPPGEARSSVKLKSKKLPKDELPTLKQLLGYYRYQKERKNIEGDVFNVMAIDLVSIWKKGLIPTMPVKAVRNKLERILKPIITDLTKNSNKIPYAITSKLDKCFNIAKCSCFNNVKSLEYIISITNRPKCNCLDVDKIPETKIGFFANQLFKHKIPKIDHKFIDSRTDVEHAEAIEKNDLVAQKVQKKAMREAQGKSQMEKQRQFLAQNQFVEFSQSSTSSNSQNLVDTAAKYAN